MLIHLIARLTAWLVYRFYGVEIDFSELEWFNFFCLRIRKIVIRKSPCAQIHIALLELALLRGRLRIVDLNITIFNDSDASTKNDESLQFSSILTNSLQQCIHPTNCSPAYFPFRAKPVAIDSKREAGFQQQEVTTRMLWKVLTSLIFVLFSISIALVLGGTQVQVHKVIIHRGQHHPRLQMKSMTARLSRLLTLSLHLNEIESVGISIAAFTLCLECRRTEWRVRCAPESKIIINLESLLAFMAESAAADVWQEIPRPTQNVLRNPRAWWFMAFRRVTARIRAARRKDKSERWRSLIAASSTRSRYVRLFAILARHHSCQGRGRLCTSLVRNITLLLRHHAQQSPSLNTLQAELEMLEIGLSRQQIALYRALALLTVEGQNFGPHQLDVLASYLLPELGAVLPQLKQNEKKSTQSSDRLPISFEIQRLVFQLSANTVTTTSIALDLVQWNSSHNRLHLEGLQLLGHDESLLLSLKELNLQDSGEIEIHSPRFLISPNLGDLVATVHRCLDALFLWYKPQHYENTHVSKSNLEEGPLPQLLRSKQSLKASNDWFSARIKIKAHSLLLELRPSSAADALARLELCRLEASAQTLIFSDLKLLVAKQDFLALALSCPLIQLREEIRVPGCLELFLDPEFRLEDVSTVAMTTHAAITNAFKRHNNSSSSRQKKRLKRLRFRLESTSLAVPALEGTGRASILRLGCLEALVTACKVETRCDVSLSSLFAESTNGTACINLLPRDGVAESKGEIAPESHGAALNATIVIEKNECMISLDAGELMLKLSPPMLDALLPSIFKLRELFSRCLQHIPKKAARTKVEEKGSFLLLVRAAKLDATALGRDGMPVLEMVLSDTSFDLHTALNRAALELSRASIGIGEGNGFRELLLVHRGDGERPALHLDYDANRNSTQVTLMTVRAMLIGKIIRERYRVLSLEIDRMRQVCRQVVCSDAVEQQTPPIQDNERDVTSQMGSWTLRGGLLELIAPRRLDSDDIIAVVTQNWTATSDNNGVVMAWPITTTSAAAVEHRAGRHPNASMNNRPLCRISLPQVELFCAVSGSARFADKRANSVRAGEAAFIPLNDDRVAPVWRALSDDQPTDLRLSVDHTDTGLLRILLEDGIFSSNGSHSKSPLVIKASLAEYYLFKSACYFDNLQEEKAPWIPPPAPEQAPYSSDQWVAEMLDDASNWEFALQLSSITLRLSLDDPLDPAALGPVQSAFMAKPPARRSRRGSQRRNEFRSDGVLKSWPFATIRSESLLVVVAAGQRAVTIACGASAMFLVDDRVHVAGLDPPYALKLVEPETSTATPGFGCDATLGLREGRHSIADPMNIFLRRRGAQRACLVTIRVTDEAVSVNVALDGVEAIAADLGIVWLLADYFKLYFIRPECFNGPPHYMDPVKFPPRAVPRTIDVKVIATRPRLFFAEAHPESARTVTSSDTEFKAIVLHADSGVFVQWTSGSDDSLHLEVASVGLSATIDRLLNCTRYLAQPPPPMPSADGEESIENIQQQRNRRLSRTSSTSRSEFDDTEEWFNCTSSRVCRVSRVVFVSESFGLTYLYDAHLDHVDARFEAPLSQEAIHESHDPFALARAPVEPYQTFANRASGGSLCGRFGMHRDLNTSARDPIFDEHASGSSRTRPHVAESFASRDSEQQCIRVVATVQDVLLTVRILTQLLGPFESNVADASTNPDPSLSAVPIKPVAAHRSSSNDAFQEYMSEDTTKLPDKSELVRNEEATSSARLRIAALDIVLVDSILEDHLPIMRLRLHRLSCASYVAHDVEDSILQLKEGSSSGTEKTQTAVSELQSPTSTTHANETTAWIDTPALAYAVGTEATNKPLTTHVIISAPFIAADYFNSTLKCWEPLIDPFEAELVVELSSNIGVQSPDSPPGSQSPRADDFAAFPREAAAFAAESTAERFNGTRKRSASIDEKEAATSQIKYRGNSMSIRAPKRIDINLTDAAMEPLARASRIVQSAIAEHGNMFGQKSKHEAPIVRHTSRQADSSLRNHAAVVTDETAAALMTTVINSNASESFVPSGAKSDLSSNSMMSARWVASDLYGTVQKDSLHAEDSSESDGEPAIMHDLSLGERSTLQPWTVRHARAPCADEIRDPYALWNQTGLELRAYQPLGDLGSRTYQLVYVAPSDKVRILFSATRTVMYNKRIREVPLCNFSQGTSDDHHSAVHYFASTNENNERNRTHLPTDPEREEIDVQLPGFRWVRVGINEFRKPGVSFYKLRPMIGSLGASAVFSKAQNMRSSWAFANALRLVADVRARDGGRTLALRSVFGIRNCSGHALEFRFDISDLASRSCSKMEHTNQARSRVVSPSSASDQPQSSTLQFDKAQAEAQQKMDAFDAHSFILAPKESSHVPVAALHDALIHSEALSLGSLRLKPAGSGDLVSALGARSAETSSFKEVKKDQSRMLTSSLDTESLAHESMSLVDTYEEDDEVGRESFFSATAEANTTKMEDDKDTSTSFFFEKRSTVDGESPLLGTRRRSRTHSFGQQQHHNQVSRIAEYGSERINLRDLVLDSKKIFANSEAREMSRVSLHEAVIRAPNWEADGTDGVNADSGDKARLEKSRSVPEHQSLKISCPIVNLSIDEQGEAVPTNTVANGMNRPINYCVEVLRSPLYPARNEMHKNVGMLNNNHESTVHAPVDYEIHIHAPIKVTNYLAEAALFEIVHGETEELLWSQLIAASGSVPVHTVSLSMPLALRISLPDFCRAVDGQAVLIHNEELEDVNSHAAVVDELDQKLFICIASRVGGGGQRSITAYVPFWMVNCTQFSIRYAQEHARDHLPAGTIKHTSTADSEESDTESVNASSPLKGADAKAFAMKANDPTRMARRAGGPGPLSYERQAQVRDGETALNAHEQIAAELDEEALTDMSFMFNFNTPQVTQNSRTTALPDVNTQKRRLAPSKIARSARKRVVASAATTFFTQPPQLQIQIDESEWSQSFSLDTIGVSQVLSVRHRELGLVELGFSISYAPGPRSAFTKIVRFVPRFIIINRLEAPLHLYQALGLQRRHGIVQVSNGKSQPFHLPQAREERNLQLQLAGNWEMTAPFPVDVAHDFYLKILRTKEDPVHAFSNRSDIYLVTIKPDPLLQGPQGFNLGLWFETDFNHRSIVIKRVMPHTYAQMNTDITKGDELLEINGNSVEGRPFKDVINIIQDAASSLELADKAFTLKFLSVEARMRYIRMKALRRSIEGAHTDSGHSRDHTDESNTDEKYVSVELKALGACVLLEVSPLNAKFAPYRIINRSSAHGILYRQKDVPGAPWLELAPRSSALYVWEDPMRAHRLHIRVAADSSSMTADMRPQSTYRISNLGLLVSEATDMAAGGSVRTVLMDVIKFREKLPIPNTVNDDSVDREYLFAHVGTEGPTRVLIITDKPDAEQQIEFIENSILRTKESLERARRHLFERHIALTIGASEIDGSGELPDAISATSVTGSGEINRPFSMGNVFTPSGGVARRPVSGRWRSQSTPLDNETQLQETTDTSRQSLGGKRPRSIDMSSDGGTENVGVGRYKFVGRRKSRLRSSSTDGHLEDIAAEALKVSALGNARDIETARTIPSLARSKQPAERCPTAIHRLYVEVLEARNLSSRSLHGYADPYCTLHLKTPSDMLLPRKSHHTYYVEKTLDPKWQNQRFELQVPPEAVTSKRGIMLRVKMYDFAIFGTDSFLGQCDVQLSKLQDEQEHDAWFPLLQRSAKLYRSQEEVSGSIHLRIRWIYTNFGLLRSKYSVAHARTTQIEELLIAQERQLKSVTLQHRRRVIGRALSLSLETDDREASIVNVFRSMRMPRSLFTGNSGGKLFSRGLKREISALSIPDIADATDNNFTLETIKENRCSDVAASDRWVKKWSRVKKKILAAVREGSEQMPPRINSRPLQGISRVSKSEYFVHKMRHAYSTERLAMMERVRGSHTRIKSQSGRLQVRPIQAINLRQSQRSVFLNVRYGPSDGVRSASATQGSVHRWIDPRDKGQSSQFTKEATRRRKNRDYRFPHVLEFEVEEDLNKSFGTMQLSVHAEHVTAHPEIGRVDIPVMNIIECLADRDEYIRWFPLAPTGDCVHYEGDDGENWWIHENEQIYASAFKEKMCIQLSLKWFPDETEESYNPSIFSISAVVAGISVTLIKSKEAHDLLQATASDIEVLFEVTNRRSRLHTTINWIQVDNQLPSIQEAVILAPTITESLQPVIQIRTGWNKAGFNEQILGLKYISVMLQELDIRVDQSLLLELWQFVTAALRHDFVGQSIISSGFSTTEALTVSDDGASSSKHSTMLVSSNYPVRQSTHAAIDKRVYIERLCLFPVKINLTIAKGADIVGVERYLPVGEGNMNNFHGLALQAFVKLLTDFLLSVTATLSNAPIKLNALFVWHIFNTPDYIASSLKEHYLNSLLRQLYKLVASLDYIGNPMSLVNSLGVGFKDFFFEPAEGLFLGPSAFALGAMRGTLSLVGNTTSGILSTAARITNTLGRIVAYPVLDADYNRWRQEQRLRSSRTGVRALTDVANGFFRGVTGIVEDPYRGMKRDGVRGFVLGIFRGAAGVAVKPVVGIIDAYAHATESLQQITSQLTSEKRVVVRRLRFSHVFGLDDRLFPYEFATALSQATVWEHPLHRELSSSQRRRPYEIATASEIIPEVVVWSAIIGSVRSTQSQRLLFVTLHRAVCTKIRKEYGLYQLELEWSIYLADDSVNVMTRLVEAGGGGIQLRVVRRRRRVDTSSPRTETISDTVVVHHRVRSNGATPNASELPFGRTMRWVGFEFNLECVVLAELEDRDALISMKDVIDAVSGNLDRISLDLNGKGRRQQNGTDLTSGSSKRNDLAVASKHISFGGWHFGVEELNDASVNEATAVLNFLSMVDWQMLSDTVLDSSNFLKDERYEKSISSSLEGTQKVVDRHPLFERVQIWHKQAREVSAQARRDPRDTERIALFKQKLEDNTISAEDFRKWMQDEQELGVSLGVVAYGSSIAQRPSISQAISEHEASIRQKNKQSSSGISLPGKIPMKLKDFRGLSNSFISSAASSSRRPGGNDNTSDRDHLTSSDGKSRKKISLSSMRKRFQRLKFKPKLARPVFSRETDQSPNSIEESIRDSEDSIDDYSRRTSDPLLYQSDAFLTPKEPEVSRMRIISTQKSFRRRLTRRPINTANKQDTHGVSSAPTMTTGKGV